MKPMRPTVLCDPVTAARGSFAPLRRGNMNKMEPWQKRRFVADRFTSCLKRLVSHLPTPDAPRRVLYREAVVSLVSKF